MNKKFVDRIFYKDRFEKTLEEYCTHKHSTEKHTLLYFEGEGGIGKTKLFEEFKEISRSKGCTQININFNDPHGNEVSTLISICQALDGKVAFPLFEYAYLEYVKKANIEPDSRIRNIKSFSEFSGAVMDFKDGNLPGFYEKIKNIWKKQIANVNLSFHEEDIKAIGNSSSEGLKEQLIEYLSKDLESHFGREDVGGCVIVFDTFEKVTGITDNPYGNELLITLEKLIEKTKSVMFVVGSRTKTTHGIFGEIEGIKLEVWDEENAVLFINENHAYNKELCNDATEEDYNAFCKKLAKFCKYYPFYLSVALDHIENNLDSNFTLFNFDETKTPDALLNRFFRGLNEHEKDLMTALACQPQWSKAQREKFDDILNANGKWEKILRFSSIHQAEDKDDTIYLHELMVEAIESNYEQRPLLITNHTKLKNRYDYKATCMTEDGLIDERKLINEGLGEKNAIAQYVYHACWLIDHEEETEKQKEAFKKLFEDMNVLYKLLEEKGVSEMLLSPFEMLSDTATKLYGDSDKTYADIRYKIGFILSWSGNQDGAQEEDRIVYETYKKMFNEKAEKYGISNMEAFHELRALEDKMVEAQGSYAYDLCRIGDYENALKNGNECYNNACLIWGENDARTLKRLSNMAYYYQKNEAPEEAQRLNKEVIAKRKMLLKDITKGYLISKISYAVFLKERGDIYEAIAAMEDVAKDSEKCLGCTDPKTLEAKQYLGNFFVRAEFFNDAIVILNKVKEQRQAQDQQSNHNTADCMVYLALAYLGSGNREKAKGTIKEALKSAQAIFDRPTTKWKIEMYTKTSTLINNANENLDCRSLVSMALRILDNPNRQGN